MNNDISFKALDMALNNGADQARITLDRGIESTISLLNGQIDKIHHSHGSSLMIQLFCKGKYGLFTTNRIEEKPLETFIKEAIKSVDILEKDEARTLPPKELCQYEKGLDLKQTDPNWDKWSSANKEEFALANENEIDRSDKRLISTATDFDESYSYLHIVDSQGFDGEVSQTIYSIGTECSILGDNGTRPQNYWTESSMFFDKLAKGCGKKAFDRTIMMLGGKQIKSGKYSVILDNTISAKLFAPIITALSGPSIQQNNSFLLNSLGKKLFSDKLTICDTPHIAGTMGATLFDGEGIATKPMPIITNGVINTYYLSTYFANKLKTTPTIEGPGMPHFTPFGEKCPTDMMNAIRKGVLITDFNGGNFNSATGDFSYGIQGFYFSNGKIVHPIKEMNITGNLLSLWNNLISVGNDPREISRWQVPSIAFENIDLSGI